MAQVVIGFIVLLILSVATVFLYQHRKNERQDLEYYSKKSMEYLLAVVKVELSEMIKDDDTILTSDVNYEAITRNKRRIEKVLTDCVHGIDSAVDTVTALIRDVVERELPDMESVNEVIDFSYLLGLDPMTKFEILLYKLRRVHGKDIIKYLDTRYKISQPRIIDDGYKQEEQVKKRCFDYKMLDNIFAMEVECEEEPVTYSEALDIIAIKLFQKYKGYDCITTLRALNIDGLNFGTAGSIRYEIEGNYDTPYRATNSVWVQINANWVHFSFLDFYTVGVMRRVVNQLTSWGTSAPMTEKVSYKVNDMYDGSRVTAIRPPVGECWACFIRKFTLKVYTMQQLLNRPNIHNWELPSKLIYFLMKAEETTAYTGQQNTGKTTLMKAAIEYTDRVNIRVLEMSFELALREIYSDRNIFTVKPTEYVASASVQDVLKKTDSYLSMVGEVAEDIVAARMVQFCLVASAYTLFSHHGKDDAGLIHGLANSLVASGEYKDHNVAISTVLDAIKNNVHLAFINGERVIEYISEIVKEDEITPYPEITELLNKSKAILKDTDTDEEDRVNQLAQVMVAYVSLSREYMTRTTDRVRFTSRKIITFNRDTMSYEANEWYSPETMQRICEKLQGQDREDFLAFWRDNWRNNKKLKKASEV